MPGISNAHLIDLLRRLYKEGDQWFRHLPREDWRRQGIYKILAGCGVNRFAHADDLRTTLQQYSAEKIARPRKALFVEPWDKAADSLLLLEPVFQKSADGRSPKLSLYLGAVRRANDRHYFMGYRYEGPEGGPHNFYHAQPIVGFDGVPTPYSLAWYPDKWPTHALNVENDCQLLLALMLAFQGMSKVQSDASTPRSPTREYAAAFIAQLTPA